MKPTHRESNKITNIEENIREGETYFTYSVYENDKRIFSSEEYTDFETMKKDIVNEKR